MPAFAGESESEMVSQTSRQQLATDGDVLAGSLLAFVT